MPDWGRSHDGRTSHDGIGGRMRMRTGVCSPDCERKKGDRGREEEKEKKEEGPCALMEDVSRGDTACLASWITLLLLHS